MKNTENRKITLLETAILFVVVTYTPNIRFITKMTAKYAQQAAWLVPVASIIVFIPLVWVLNKLLRGFKGAPFTEMLNRAFGKVAGKIISVVTLIWLMILLGLYIKYAGEKLVSSTYVGADLRILIFLLVVVVGIILRAGIHVLTRMTKIILLVALAQFLLICAMLLFMDFSMENVTPISTQDIVPVLTTVRFPMTIMAYIMFILVFNDKIDLGKKSLSKLNYTMSFEVLTNVILILSVLGFFGYELTDKLAFPFLSAVRNIEVTGGTTGLESLSVAIWVAMEFVTISFFTYLIVRLIKNIFGLNNETPVLTAVLAFGYFFAIYICNDVFELAEFSEYIVSPMNIALGFVVPVLLFVTAKIRKQL